jgi:hypothetical protein
MDLSPRDFAQIITLTRSGTATRVNAAGLIETVAANVPRFDYDPISRALRGLLVEEERTNLALQSEAFDNAAWTKTNITVPANQAVAPDGAGTADRPMVNNGVSLNAAGVSRDFTKAATATTYTWSVFAKAAQFNRIGLGLQDSSNNANSANVVVSLVDGSISSVAAASGTFTAASATVQAFPDGWYRVSLTCTSGTETSIRAWLYVRDSVATTGTGTSGVTMWGAQLEVGPMATSYVPTTTAAVARGAESVVIGGNNFAQVYNQSEGTIFAVVRPSSFSGINNCRFIEMNNGAFANSVCLMATSYRSVMGYIARAAAFESQMEVANKWNVGVRIKAAYAFRANDVALSVDGAILTDTGTTVVPSGITEMNIASVQYSPANAMNGWIETLRYFPTRLPNAQLQALTA